MLIDRYISSSIAYGKGRNLPRWWCEIPVGGNIAPDMTVLMDLDPTNAQARLCADVKERSDNLEFETCSIAFTMIYLILPKAGVTQCQTSSKCYFF